MLKQAIRRFTTEGKIAFRDYLALGPRTIKQPPTELLLDDRYSTPLAIGLVEQRVFDTKFDMGMHVVAAVGKEKLPALLNEPDVWPWLSLYFYESTFPKKGSEWFIGARSRHIVERISGRQQDHSHRHLVRGAVVAVQRFDMHARVLMERPYQQSKMEEQIMSRKSDLGLAGSPNIIKLIYRLYWDASKNAVLKGAKGDGPGSIMRLITVLRQLDATFDVASLSPDRLLALLPRTEFKRFAEAA